MKNITLEQLLHDSKYRAMSIKDLSEVIDSQLKFDDYKKLKGEWSEDKAKLLYNEWHVPKESHTQAIVAMLNNKITGEEMQNILKEVGMEEQMLRQLMMTQPIRDVHNLYDERMRYEYNIEDY